MTIQLRVRTEYSFGECFAKVDRVIQRLKEIGCKAAAIVDKSSWGHVAWHEACTKAGIEPLLGMEIVVSDDDRRTAMWFIARNTTGLAELYRVASQAYHQPATGRGGKFPRLYRADVEAMSGDIHKFAGDILDGPWLASIGANIDVNPGSRILAMQKRQLAAAHGLPLVETCDNAYAYEADAPLFEIVGSGAKPTAQHLYALPPNEAAEHILATSRGIQLPKAPMVRTPGDLEALCRAGIARRGMAWTEEYEQRLQYELELIRSKDFESYFLVVADMCEYAKRDGILKGPSRGSAAGSLVCYVSGITEIDPIPPKLYFERFIDVSRTDLPDVDLDYDDRKRHLVFEYMAQKYGANNTAKIGTISRYQPKSALIEVCKAIGIPASATAALKMSIIVRSSADSRASNCLEDTFKETDAGRQFIAAYPQVVVAGEIEGHASHTGVHAAGLLICNEPITNYAVVDAEGIAHVEKTAAEKLGLLKIDVLGLRTLGILADSGVDVDWYSLPLDDPQVFEIFNQQKLCGIFQFEGNALRAISRDIEFKSLREVDAVTALARPGPFGGGVTEEWVKRSKGKKYEPIHPLVEKQMADTYGLPVYQEQTLAIVREIGKFDWKETSTIRKAMSKRMGKEFFDTYWEKFRIGATSQGIPEEAARKTWEQINAMGAWAMNKCIAAGTLVRVTTNNTNVPIWCPIEELYDKYIASPSPWIRQQKSMPRLMSLFPDGSGRPQTAKAIHKNGEKQCVELLFDDGTTVRCTPDHKFIIDGEWKVCAEAVPGSEFVALERKRKFNVLRGNTAKGKKWLLEGNDRSGANNIAYTNGATKAKNEYKRLRAADPCDRCAQFKAHMEVHHNDLNEGRDRPNDLAWLCSGCHKTVHHQLGDRGKPFEAGAVQTTKLLVSMLPCGELETYDIEMPEHHNYVIDGGIVTHNSHTWSYAVISYWTAWLKRHHPLKFAAANLRNAKDDDSALELLREMSREGIEFVPFSMEHSQPNWSEHDGKLMGGLMNLHGFGAVNSAKWCADRDAGRLTPKQIEKAQKAHNKFGDIFPFHSRYGDYYTNPRSKGIIGDVWKVADFDGKQRGSHVFLGEIIYKNSRNYNEDVNVKKRGGKLGTGPLEFLDVRLRDDTGVIGARFGRFDYERMGRHVAENVPVGAHMMVRADFIDGIRFGFIQNYRVLS